MRYLFVAGKSGVFALVDDEDYERLIPFVWYTDSKGYVYRAKSGKKRIFLHQFIMGTYPEGKPEIDHINGNKRDCRRENLRFCTSAENRANRQKYRSNKSGYKGVQWHKQGQKWMARVYKNKRPHYLGLFATALKAHEAIQKEAKS